MRLLLFALECTWTHAVVSPLAVRNTSRSAAAAARRTRPCPALGGQGIDGALHGFRSTVFRRRRRWGARVRLRGTNGCPIYELAAQANFGFGVGFIATRQPARAPARPGAAREADARRGHAPKAAVAASWLAPRHDHRRVRPSEADLRAEIAKLELELKGVTEKARSQEAHDARSQEPTEPKKKPRRRGKKKNKMSDAIQEARQEVQRCPRSAQCRLDLARAYEGGDN